MYSRRLDKRTLSFGHEGILYKDSFLKYDHQTRSLWVHVTGECIVGALKGRRLAHFPSTVTTWRDWKRRYPETGVLEEAGRANFFGTFLGLQAEQLRYYSLCLVHDGQAKAYPLAGLRKQQVVNDVVGGAPVLVVFSARLQVGNLWRREAGGKLLTFSLEEETTSDGPVLRDAETGSVWRGLEGRCTRGPLEGAQLAPLTHHPILHTAFRRFYPRGEVYER